MRECGEYCMCGGVVRKFDECGYVVNGNSFLCGEGVWRVKSGLNL